MVRARPGWAAMLVSVCLIGAAPAWAAALAPAPALSQTEQTTSVESAAGLRAEAIRFEHGEGVVKDGDHAAALYCRAALLGDVDSMFSLGWMHANGRGVERNDAWAAFLFEAAAAGGVEQARRMLSLLDQASAERPPCMAPLPEPDMSVPAPDDAAAAVDAPLPRPIDRPSGAPKPILDMVQQMAPSYQLWPELVLAIMKAESNFDSSALSPKNAMGLMQLIPQTAERFNVKNPYDPKQNIRGGMAYLRWLLARFQGDVSLVAAAYNAGERTVERYLGVPPYGETRAYVKRVVDALGVQAHPFDASVVEPFSRLGLMRAPKTIR